MPRGRHKSGGRSISNSVPARVSESVDGVTAHSGAAGFHLRHVCEATSGLAAFGSDYEEGHMNRIEKRRQYAICGGVALILTGIFFLNERAVIRADDDHCYWDSVASACAQFPDNKCTDATGYRCYKELNLNSCFCGTAAE